MLKHDAGEGVCLQVRGYPRELGVCYADNLHRQQDLSIRDIFTACTKAPRLFIKTSNFLDSNG